MAWNRNLIVKTSGGADAPPPGRGSRRLDRALRVVDAGPRPFYLAAVVSLAVTSLLTLAVSALVRPAGPLPGAQREMIYGSLVALCLCAVLAIASLALRGGSRRTAWLDRVVGPQQRAAVWLALAAWFPFFVLVVYYRAKGTFPVTEQWLYYGFADKRWRDATYLLATIAPMLWLTVAARVLTVGRGHPPTWRTWLAGLFPHDGATAGRGDTVDVTRAQPAVKAEPAGWWRSRAGRILLVAAGLATALMLAWYFMGPPWYLSQDGQVVTPQEDVWLLGFQAIAHGQVPYTGPATVQYGPGTQLASYLIMRHLTSFSIVGFRQSWAIYQWVGTSLLFAVFFLAFGYFRGLAISLLDMLVYTGLQEVAFRPGGSFGGYMGWANPLRYVGTIALVALLPVVIRRCRSRWGIAAGAALGVLWGLTSYLAQENLIAGAVGALVIAALLLFSRTYTWRAVRTALAAVLAGFLVIWLPILAFYVVHADLGQFLKTYFLLPLAMAKGYGNDLWQGGGQLPFSITTMFYALPFVLAVSALLMVFDGRPLRIAVGWSRDRERVAVAVIFTILLYQGVLLRSDQTDMTGTMLVVPALVIALATMLPRLLGGCRRVTVTLVGAALFAASFLMLPTAMFTWTSVRSQATAPYLDRARMAAAPHPDSSGTLAAKRVGAGLNEVAQCCQGPPFSMPSLVHDMERIHELIGDRPTYVADFPHGYPGFVYFVAALNPVIRDKYNTILNGSQLTAYMENFRTNVLPHTQALVAGTLKDQEAQYFLQRYPTAHRIPLHLGSKPYWVLLAQG